MALAPGDVRTRSSGQNRTVSTRMNKNEGKWSSVFIAVQLIIEGTTEKVLKMLMTLSKFTTETLVSLYKKCNFEHYTEFQARKTINAMKKISVHLFRAAPYMLMLLLHKDVLFHQIPGANVIKLFLSDVRIFILSQSI